MQNLRKRKYYLLGKFEIESSMIYSKGLIGGGTNRSSRALLKAIFIKDRIIACNTDYQAFHMFYQML